MESTPISPASNSSALEGQLASERISLCETLDRVLNKGVVIVGEAVVTVANVDLLYLGLNVVLTSVETMNQMKDSNPPESGP